MPTNISKYVALTDFLLLEYEFNRDGSTLLMDKSWVAYSKLDSTKQFFNPASKLGVTNNVPTMNSMPTNIQRTQWYIDPSGSYNSLWDTSAGSFYDNYPYDTIKIHIISGYNFDDVGGLLLQIRALDGSTNKLVDLTNFTFINQTDAIGSDNVMKFASNSLYLGNKFYDKYIQLKVPSIQELGGDVTSAIGQLLSIVPGSDVYVTYATIPTVVNNQFVLDNILNLQLPVVSAADNFNCFISESTAGDYIEYYATWNDQLIGTYISDIESGRIRLYMSNNPNDNYEDFSATYGTTARKWVLMHELYIYENLAGPTGGTSLLTQKFVFTQDDNFNLPNYFRPVLKNADIDATYSIQYICRLMNRMDGTQIIRKAAFASTNPKKYGLNFTTLNVNNIIPYKVFNKLEAEKPNIVNMSGKEVNKYVKVFVDTTTITLNSLNEVFPQGTGPLFLKSNDSVYKFKFEKFDKQNNKVNVDLSGAYNYSLLFKLTDNTKIEISPSYSTNMNTTLGEIEFKLTADQITSLLAQTNNNYSIVVKNPDGTSYTYYEGVFYSYSDLEKVMSTYTQLTNITELQTKITDLETQITTLTSENALLKTK